MDWIPHTRIQGLTQKVIQTVTPLNTVANQVLYSLPSYLFNNAKDALDLIFKRSFKYTVLESVLSSGDIISPVEGAYYIIGSPQKYYQYVLGNFVELEPVKEYDVINITANNNGMSYVQGGNFHAVPCIQIKQYPLTGNDANDAEALIYDDDLQEIVFRSPLTVKIADIVTITNNVDFMGNPRTQLSIVGDYTFLIHAGDSILLRYLNQNIYEVLDCSFDSVNTNIIINANGLDTSPPLGEIWGQRDIPYKTSQLVNDSSYTELSTLSLYVQEANLDSEVGALGYIKTFTETDPIFSASAAASITATDITNLSNLSGTNTGDQDLSGYQTIAGLDTAVSGLGYIKTLSGHNVSELTNDSGYITASALSGYVPTSRTLTINGTGYDLSTDRSWTISAGAVAWGSVTGTLSDQTDLNAALSGKQAALVSGTNIKTINSNSILGSGDLTVSGGDTTTSEGALINSATDKATPVDGDYVGLMDSAASNILKKLSWSNIKATLKTYFDTLYTTPLLLQVSLSSNQSINHNTFTLLSLATETVDTLNAFDNTAGNYSFTVPSSLNNKWVRLDFRYVMEGNTSGVRIFCIYKNANPLQQIVIGAGYEFFASCPLKMSTGDVYTFKTYQNSGSAKNQLPATEIFLWKINGA